MNRSKELTAGLQKNIGPCKRNTRKKTFQRIVSSKKTQASPEDIYSIDIPALTSNQCIIPDTMALLFKLTNSNTKS